MISWQEDHGDTKPCTNLNKSEVWREVFAVLISDFEWLSVADPGFPIGGANLIGGVNSRRGYISKNLYIEMKESGPLGGCAGSALPGSANGYEYRLEPAG